MFYGQYAVQTDSLNDYGLIEFSPDNGTTWIDIINDTLYSSTFLWYSPKPVLTGNSYGWEHFDVSMADIGSVFNIQLGDTLLLRFSFISDSIADNQDGLMYDNLCFTDFVEGISETSFKPIKSKIFPNPVKRIFTIEFENPDSELFQLSIYDIHSNLIFTRDNISENNVVIDAQSFEQGTFIYKLTNLKAQERSWGKFIIVK